MCALQTSEEDRLKALNSYHILDTPPEAEFDRLTALASSICDVPIALISLIDEDRQWFKSKVGIDIDETRRCVAFCSLTIMSNGILEVEDARTDDRFKDNPMVTGAPHIQFYAGFPLIDPAGFKLGTICVIDVKPGKLNGEQRIALGKLSELAISAILTRRKSEEESHFRKIFDLSNDLICIVDGDGVFTKVNPAFTNLLGWNEQELLGETVFRFIPAAERERSEREFEKMKNGDISRTFTNKTLKRDGTWIYTQWVTVAEDGTGLFYCVGRDISIQREQEKKLRLVNEFLEQTGRVSDIGGWEVDLQNETIYWTNQTRQIHEVDDDFEPTLESALNFYKDDDRERIRDAVAGTIRNGLPYDLEMRIITAKGREIWVRAIGEAEFENGVCKRLFGTFQNIDLRKREEIASQQTREMLDNILKSATEVSIIATGDDGIITVFNAGAENLTGYKAEDMIGKQTPSILHKQGEVEAEYLKASGQFKESHSDFGALVYDARLRGRSRSEWTYVRKDGSEYTGSLVINAIRNTANEITGYLGISTDISEQKKTEQVLSRERARLTAFVDHAPAAVAMFDTDIRYIACSRQWQLEYRLGDQKIIGESHYTVFPNITEEWKEIHQRALKGEIIRNECDIWRPAGWDHDQYLRWEVRPWQQEDGTTGGIMMLTEDITGRVKEQEELKVAKQLAEEANRAKSDFLASMSHEIRTPLNGVIGFTDLLLKTELNDTQRQYLQIVNQSGNALLEIINDILDFSKIEAGKLDLDISEFDLYEMASQAANVISYQAQKRGVEVLLNIGSDLPRFATGDSVRIRQVIINLLSNAAKFTEKGEIELKISLISKNGMPKIRFKVRDTGIGIKPERQSKIFEAFTQEDVSTTKKYGGTGLGLAISNRLLAMMGSKMELVSAPGKGSTFFFELQLPFRHGEEADWESLDRIHSVLVADDNSNNRTILKQMLMLKQIRVEEAKNGLEVLNALNNGHTFDVVILDFHMPFLNGLETAGKIRANAGIMHQPQLVLLHSSPEDLEIQRQCKEFDIKVRLSKPVKLDELFGGLSRLYGKSDNLRTAAGSSPLRITRSEATSILVAEDNKVNMLLTRTIITRVAPQATILEATNGQEAVTLFNEYEPDLILMDIQMPGMNGYEATALIRQSSKGKAVPVIALTAASVKGEREKCIQAGMNDYITKPFVEKTLFEVLSTWLPTGTSPEGNKDGFVLNDDSLHFDIKSIHALLGDDKQLITELLDMTIRELTDTDNLLKINGGAGDLKELNRIGHHLYNTAAASGMKELSKLAKELEQIRDSNAVITDELIMRVREEIKLVCSLINRAW